MFSLVKKLGSVFRTGYKITTGNEYDDPQAYEALVRTFWGRGALARHIADIFEQYVPVGDRKKRVLDMASGTGIISIELAKRGYHVWASDISSEALEYLRLQNPAINREICDFNKGFPFQDNFFDAATSVWANRYITSDGLRIFLREMHRVLKPGAVLIWPIFPADTVLWKVRSGVGQITSASGLIDVIKAEGFSEAVQLNDLFYKNLFSFKLPPQTVPIYIVARK